MALLCAMSFLSKAQYANQFILGPSLFYIYVGSLDKDQFDLGNAEKLQVEVFGGGWGSVDIGVTTYYIANRDGLNIHQVILGGPNNGYFELRAYDNGPNNIDFYIVSANWTAIGVKSFIIGSSATPNQLITNTMTQSVPGTLHPITILPVLVTDDNGNMAVKTNIIDPDHALSVNGSIRAKEVKVEAGWADYVFDKKYPLRSLKEVENYIGQNKHLPDVPSAAEVAKNGVKVGETEALLLKKIEELTLYLIEKDKQLQLQEKRLKALEQRYRHKNNHVNK